jgi:hypothetical protein
MAQRSRSAARGRFWRAASIIGEQERRTLSQDGWGPLELILPFIKHGRVSQQSLIGCGTVRLTRTSSRSRPFGT